MVKCDYCGNEKMQWLFEWEVTYTDDTKETIWICHCFMDIKKDNCFKWVERKSGKKSTKKRSW